MRSILIAHRDATFVERLASELRPAGYRVISCPGPWPAGLDECGHPYNLAVDSALAHPDIPMLLAWPETAAPDLRGLRDIRTQAPHVRIAARPPSALVRQMERLLSTTALSPR